MSETRDINRRARTRDPTPRSSRRRHIHGDVIASARARAMSFTTTRAFGSSARSGSSARTANAGTTPTTSSHRIIHRARRSRTATSATREGEVKSDVAPRPFTVREGELGKVASAAIPLVIRLGTGALIAGYKLDLVEDDATKYSPIRIFGKRLNERSTTLPSDRAKEPIVMYEYEGSPYCKKVREALSVLDCDVLFKPCPQGSEAFRAESKRLGATTYPFMVDPNTGTSMGESDDIIEYLFKTYGGETKIPLLLKRDSPLTNFTAYAAAVSRLKALRARPAKKIPEKPLELWTYEISPFSKLVREALTELCIPHVVKYTPRGSRKRDELFAEVSHFQVPFMRDPNTGVQMFESKEICEYIEREYGDAA